MNAISLGRFATVTPHVERVLAGARPSGIGDAADRVWVEVLHMCHRSAALAAAFSARTLEPSPSAARITARLDEALVVLVDLVQTPGELGPVRDAASRVWLLLRAVRIEVENQDAGPDGFEFGDVANG